MIDGGKNYKGDRGGVKGCARRSFVNLEGPLIKFHHWPSDQLGCRECLGYVLLCVYMYVYVDFWGCWGFTWISTLTSADESFFASASFSSFVCQPFGGGEEVHTNQLHTLKIHRFPRTKIFLVLPLTLQIDKRTQHCNNLRIMGPKGKGRFIFS